MADAQAFGPPRPNAAAIRALAEQWSADKAAFRDGTITEDELDARRIVFDSARTALKVDGDLARFGEGTLDHKQAQRRKADLVEHGRLPNPRKAGRS